MSKKTINGFRVEVEQGWYDPDDDSFGSRPSASRPNQREAWGASIANKWHHETSLHPFDSEDAAYKAARKWTDTKKAHRLLR